MSKKFNQEPEMHNEPDDDVEGHMHKNQANLGMHKN